MTLTGTQWRRLVLLVIDKWERQQARDQARMADDPEPFALQSRGWLATKMAQRAVCINDLRDVVDQDERDVT